MGDLNLKPVLQTGHRRGRRRVVFGLLIHCLRVVLGIAFAFLAVARVRSARSEFRLVGVLLLVLLPGYLEEYGVEISLISRFVEKSDNDAVAGRRPAFVCQHA